MELTIPVLCLFIAGLYGVPRIVLRLALRAPGAPHRVHNVLLVILSYLLLSASGMAVGACLAPSAIWQTVSGVLYAAFLYVTWADTRQARLAEGSEQRLTRLPAARRVLRAMAFAASVALLAGVLWLRVGGTQLSKYHYVFYVFDLNEWRSWRPVFDDIDPGPGYTGRWRTWHRNGQMSSESTWRDGRLHGKRVKWDVHGAEVSVSWYHNGEKVSEERYRCMEGDRGEAGGAQSTKEP